MKVDALSETDCRALLARGHLARLGCVQNNRPYVVPLTYAYDSHALYAFSMPGKKVEWMRANPAVCAVVEEHGPGRNWQSVVVEGQFEELPERIGSKLLREHAWQLLSRHANWWEPGGLKPDQLVLADHAPHLFFRINVENLSGRRAVD